VNVSDSGIPRIDLFYFDAGGGHRASAQALRSVVERQRRPWQVRMVNLRAVLDASDPFKRVTGCEIEHIYNWLLGHGLTFGSGVMLRATQRLIRHLRPRLVAALCRYFTREAPDLLVSMIPNFNQVLFEGLERAARKSRRPVPPMATILTDMADYPPHFWIERQPQYLLCATATARAQALAMGHDPRRVFRTSGMIVRPEFYDAVAVEREAARRELRLRPELPTGLVLFGGHGSRQMLQIARHVARSRLAVQLIFMCGHNRSLREQLASVPLPFPHHEADFTPDIPRFMALADFFVGKPGPGSLSEAMVMGLPVIVERNAWTMVQERYNTEWILRHQAGIVLRSFSEIVPAIAELAQPAQRQRYRERIGRIRNRAVFEVPDILATILARSASVGGGSAAHRTVMSA
jgi:1,2-diacylglycerol 3-beta-galactosyltransferase